MMKKKNSEKYKGLFKRTILLLFISVTIYSCNNNKFYIDVSDIKINVNIKRFDRDLEKFNIDSSEYYISKYKKDSGEFFTLYNLQIIRIGSSDSIHYPEKLFSFLKYCRKEKISKIVNEKYPDLNTINSELTEALKHYKYYFPEKSIPDIYACISAFNESAFTSENVLGISLDKYLGKDCEFYTRLNLDNYIKRRMVKEMIVTDVMNAICKASFPYESEDDNILTNMIYNGKVQYYLNCMLPNTSDTLKWRYTNKQMKWAKNNEHNIWNYLAEKKMLFKTNAFEIKKFVGNGPFTVAFSKISAPRAANYVGYKVVESYMKNTEVSLKKLMGETDARKILEKARYNP